MKILLHSYSAYGAWFLTKFAEEGHQCDYFLEDKKWSDVLSGIVPKPFHTKPLFDKYDLVFFDLTGKPKAAEQSMLVTPTLGDGNLHCELEENRKFGIEVMEECGIDVPPYEGFNDVGEAKRFIKKTAKRYVFKPDGGQEADVISTYVSKDAEDLLKFLDKLAGTSAGEFILQEVIEGTEISTEAWFDGQEFYLINSTLEEKKFMNDNKGGNTGCAGNVVFTFSEAPYLFREGLGKMKDWLAGAGYRGMMDLNTICTGTKAYGLEFTPRFGYDATATLGVLFKNSMADFMQAIASGAGFEPELRSNFSAGIRLSIPPYPTEIEGKHPEGIPIEGIEPDDLGECFLFDAMVPPRSDELVTCGSSGFIAVPMAYGASLEESFGKVNEKIKRIQIPNCQYRTDLPRTTQKRFDILRNQGWFR